MIDRPVEPMIMTHLFKKASKLRIPLSGAFEISPECNMSCKMCYAKLTKEQMSKIGRKRTVEEWLDLARQARDEGLLYILITGGEPFLQHDFKKLYFGLKKMGFVISINSNGTLIDEKIVEWLSKDPPSRINITLYGSSNETYKRLCNNPKGFDQVTKAIRLLKNANIDVRLNASMTPENIDDLDEMYSFATENKLIIKTGVYMFPPIRVNDNSFGKNNRFTSIEAGRYSVYNDVKMFDKEKFIKRAEKIKKGIIDDDVEVIEDSCKILEGGKLRCRAGKSTFWMTWDGKMMTCGIMDKPIAYPFEVGFKNAWDTIVEKTDELRLPVKCLNCKKSNVCQVCAAVSYTETGNVSGVPTYMCEMTEEIIKETSRIYNQLLNKD